MWHTVERLFAYAVGAALGLLLIYLAGRLFGAGLYKSVRQWIPKVKKEEEDA